MCASAGYQIECTEKGEARVVTRAGTCIRRWRPAGVGKMVGSRLYVHQQYSLKAMQRLPEALVEVYWEGASRLCFRGWDYNCLRFDTKANSVMFVRSPDFDTADEPHVGELALVTVKGIVYGSSRAIYHHKWLWVQDDYQGFNVAEAIERSRNYCRLLKTPPKGYDAPWQAQLREIGIQ